MPIEYRPLANRAEIEQAVSLYSQIWVSGDREAVPYHILTAIGHAGGLVLGAFDGSELVGMTVSFLGRRDGILLHWSHLAGVRPDYQGRGIGSALKWLQRRLVLEQGYNCISWTYSPLQRGNAAFNIHRLGCVCNCYQVEFYGEMQDSLNAGLPSDRFEVRWWLESPRVCQRAFGVPPEPDVTGWHVTLASQKDGAPGKIDWPEGVGETLVEIPYDINLLRKERPDLVSEWLLRAREVFTRLFSEGFCVVDFTSRWAENGARAWYMLRRGGEG